MTIALLQLSDIHIKTARDKVLERASHIAATFNAFPHVQTIFVVVTGDVAHSGDAEQYKHAEAFFAEILRALRARDGVTVHFVAIPGNHDNNYQKCNGIRQSVISTIASKPADKYAHDMIDLCSSVQDEFFSFLGRFDGGHTPANRIYFKRRYDTEHGTIGFHCLNTAWGLKKDSNYGDGLFPLDYIEGSHEPSDIEIALLHHPPRWLKFEAQSPFQRHVENTTDVVLTGHEHEPGHNRIIGEMTTVEYYKAGALQPDSNLPHSEFMIVFLDLAKRMHSRINYAWKDGKYERSGTTEARPFARNDNIRSGLFPNADFEMKFLHDPGGIYTHPHAGQLRFEDVYVEPQFAELHRPGQKPKAEIVSTGRLVDILKDKRRVVVYGVSYSGKSSFGKYLFRRTHKEGTIPLIVEGGKLKSSEPSKVIEAIESTFNEQYAADRLEQYRQLNPEQRVLILDGIEICTLSRTDRTALFPIVEAYFGTILILADDDFRLDEFNCKGMSANPLMLYQNFQLMQFGYQLRSAIVKKWHNLSRGRLPDETVDNLIRTSERVLQTMVNLGVPKLPLYLLAALQNEESNRKPDSPMAGQTGSFGFIHDSLVNTRLGAEDRPVQQDLSDRFLAELAYAMFKQNRRSFTLEEYAAQHRWYDDAFAVHNLDREKLYRFFIKNSFLAEEWT